MANASQKRIASQNEKTVKTLQLGMILPTLLHFLLRLLFRRSSLPPSKTSLAVYILAYIPTFFLTRYLENIGTVKRDASGTLISSGEDLAQGGITEWCFDIIYVTWACQIGSGAFGNKVWYLWLVIPAYGGFMLWTKFISPMVLGRSSSGAAAAADGAEPKETVSKRQEKLKKRGERGDPRIQQRARQ
ncbi:putative opsin [Athelia psychrophila]|uniref:Opsin n=1 Tax=Athelia psychrophila TaxID=1759441 RepID=A0A166N348_9AGAM|nr:putative opsin [Fibularhizoctonia sp. CBS 109695]